MSHLAKTSYRQCIASRHITRPIGKSNSFNIGRNRPCGAITDDAGPLMTPEEEAVLNEIMQARRDKRKADILEHKRRSKFDPIAAKNKAEQAAAAAAGSSMQPPAASHQPSSAASHSQQAGPERSANGDKISAVSRSSAEAPPQIPALKVRPQNLSDRPRLTPAPPRTSTTRRTINTPLKPSKTEAVIEDIDSEDEDVDEDEFEAAAMEFLRQEKRNDQPQIPLRKRTIIAPGSFKPRSSGISSQSSSSPSASRPVSSSKSTASTEKQSNRLTPSSPSGPMPKQPISNTMPDEREEVVTKEDLAGLEGLGLEGLEGMTRAQLEALLADDEAEQMDGSEGGGEAEELDWDTLEAGESFERYLTEIKKEAEQAKMMRDREEARRSREKVRASAKIGDQVQQSMKGLPNASLLGSKSISDTDLGDVDEEQDAEFDQLLKLMEMVGKEEDSATDSASVSPSASGIKRTVAGSKQASDARAQKAGDDIDWGVLEKMFLGDGWDREIQELADQVTHSGDILFIFRWIETLSLYNLPSHSPNPGN